ncbi:MAG: excinuclease ABC subunit C, partial [Spirochaetaceae bacterium]
MQNSQAFHNEELRKAVSEFPTSSGVYIMRSSDDTVLYVGKAKNLRNRVRSYLSAGQKHIKTAVLMRQVDRIEHIITSSEAEALLLENTLIKRYQPRYNISLKDSKSYPVIRITKEDYPRIFRTRQVVNDGSQYFGPYPQVQAIDMYLELIERLYPLRKCRGKVKPRPQPCLYYHIGRCAGACAGKISQEDYKARVAAARSLLEGDAEKVNALLEKQMKEASSAQRYEEAAWFRDAIRALEDLQARQSVIDFDPETRDYIAMQRQAEHCVFTVFQMRGGQLLGSESFRALSVEDDSDAIQEFIARYYSTLRSAPHSIFCQMPLDWPEELSAAEQQGTYGEQPKSVGPQMTTATSRRDASIIEMAAENARQELARWRRAEG